MQSEQAGTEGRVCDSTREGPESPLQERGRGVLAGAGEEQGSQGSVGTKSVENERCWGWVAGVAAHSCMYLMTQNCPLKHG